MKAFGYARPHTVEQAVERLTAAGDARALSGGMTLIPTLKQGLASPSDLVDLAGIDDLYGIVVAGDEIRIGAMTRHYDVATSQDVTSLIPGLAALAGRIGDVQVRNRGTIGGSVANNDPAADYPAALVALGATVITDRRELAAEAFFTGMFETALAFDELVVAVRFPVTGRTAYAKFPNPVSRYAMAGVFVAEHPGGMRVAVTGAGPCVFRASTIESALAAELCPAAARGAAIDSDTLIGDMHGSAAYRANLVSVMAERAVAALLNGGASG